MARILALVAAGLSLSLPACHAVSTSHALAEGVTAQAKPADSQVDVLEGRPSRPFRSLGTVEVRVDRGNALNNPTLSDAIPALSAEARRIGADAIILTHEEFTSWFDKGEDASPIHDLERQETWYITEKARYVSGVAIAYTGPACAAPIATPYRAPATVIPAPMMAPGPVYVTPARPPAPVYVQPPPAPVYIPPPPAPAPSVVMPPPAPAPAPPPDGTMPVAPTAPSLPEGPIELPPAPEAPNVPDLPPLPEAPQAPEPPPAPEAPKLPGGVLTASLPAPYRVAR